jgi:hypothetical protein
MRTVVKPPCAIIDILAPWRISARKAATLPNAPSYLQSIDVRFVEDICVPCLNTIAAGLELKRGVRGLLLSHALRVKLARLATSGSRRPFKESLRQSCRIALASAVEDT